MNKLILRFMYIVLQHLRFPNSVQDEQMDMLSKDILDVLTSEDRMKRLEKF